jgi:hypothetical protein
MRCRLCDKEASGVCVFCGKGVCSDCAKSYRHISGIAAQGERGVLRFPTGFLDYIVVENATWCGDCTIKVIQRPEGFR